MSRADDALEKLELRALLAQPAFIRFLNQMAAAGGILGSGSEMDDGRLLVREGRRGLALLMIRHASKGAGHDDPDAAFAATLIQVLTETVQASVREKPNARRRGRDDDGDDDGGDPA